MSRPLEALYREVILEHAREPRGRGRLAAPTVVQRGSASHGARGMAVGSADLGSPIHTHTR